MCLDMKSAGNAMQMNQPCLCPLVVLALFFSDILCIFSVDQPYIYLLGKIRGRKVIVLLPGQSLKR
jgi:hypothetical protein